MLTLNLTPIFKARGIDKPYSFLVKAGLTAHSATNILNSQTRIFRLDHVELLCKVLVCEPNDLLLWTPNSGEKFEPNFPLSKLIQVETGLNNWKETLATMPFKELKEVTKAIITKQTE